ncbi:MAG: hypothetical protein Q9186_001942 [Xanthomendoza sp. 1 TL-2023]
MASDTNDDQLEVDRKIVMAVDFGTTYSGLAWAQTRKPEIHSAVIQWPDATSGGLEGMTSDKVPTEIQYNDQGCKWGFQIGDFGQRHQWFKLGLDPTQSRGTSDLAKKFLDPNAAPPAYDHGPEDLTKDYLTALRSHAERVLRHKLPESALESTPVEFIITVPAVWSERAQASTRRCAEQAGMGLGSNLHVVTEPEAAAVYALDAMDPHNIKIGDTFILCDAGGGTVDLISYKVSELKPSLRIEEAAPGSGSLCGSSFLNRIFQKFLTERLGTDSNFDDDVVEEAMNRFEFKVTFEAKEASVTTLIHPLQAKRSFNGNPTDEYLFPVPGLRDSVMRGVRHGRLRLLGSDMRVIFDPVIKEIIDLINGQIEATRAQVKAVLMVGGFSQNVYLRDSIRQAVLERGIEVMQSPNGWTAVCRGALMKAMESTSTTFNAVKISGRVARKNYGTTSHKKLDSSIHNSTESIKHRFWYDFYGEDRIITMDWLIQKGQKVQENKPMQFPYSFYRLSPYHDIVMKICVCGDREELGPSIYEDSRVNTLVTLSADLSRIPLHLFPTSTGADGLLYYKIQVSVQVTHYSGYTKYELIHNKINYGPITAEYV